MQHTTPDIFHTLAGTWCLTRTVDGFGQATGTATFEKGNSNELIYNESIETTLTSGSLIEGQQSYVYKLEDSKINIYFNLGPDKGGFFCGLDIKADRAEANHLCKNDNYYIEFIYKNNNAFEITYTVSGPRKDYVHHTVYTRER